MMMREMTMGWTQQQDLALRLRAQKVLPGGMYGHQSTAMLPPEYPQFFSRAEGAHIWDCDGNRYLDFMCGYGPNLFGYANSLVDDAFREQLAKADCMTGPSPLIIDLAEKFTSMVDHADWAMFCKNGTDANTMAMMTARKHTGKRVIIRAHGAYHGTSPWCALIKHGTTENDQAHQIFYTYNDVTSLEAAVAEAGDDLAGIFASPIKHDVFVDQELPRPAYAKRARELCDETGALLIVDDVRAGFRLARDCSWALIGVNPDLSSWGKAIANGHPLSCLLGSRKAEAAASAIYVTGSYWFAAAPMAASLVTLDLIAKTDYLERSIELGQRLRSGFNDAATRFGFSLRQTGPAQMPIILFDDDPAYARSYFWNTEMLKQGVYLHPWHNMFISNAMTEGDIDFAIAAASHAFEALAAVDATVKPHEKLVAMFAVHQT
jgi:glutamate-1-semialdehyde 2,1-aminomutase